MESWPTGRLLVVAARLAEQAFRDFLEAHDLTMAGMHVLMVLQDSPRTQAEVAVACGVRNQTIGRTIDRLVRAGLATRERDPDDRRRLIVRPSDRGNKILATVSRHSLEGAERPDDLGPSFFDELEDPARFRADLAHIIRRLHAVQTTDQAAQWSAMTERWAALDQEHTDWVDQRLRAIQATNRVAQRARSGTAADEPPSPALTTASPWENERATAPEHADERGASE